MGKDEKQFRSRLIAGVFSLLFSTAILFGARLDSVENVDVGDAALWIQLVTFAVLFTGMVCLLWGLLDSSVKRRPKGERRISQIITAVAEKIGGYADILSFLFFFCAGFPCFWRYIRAFLYMMRRMNIYRWRQGYFPHIIRSCMYCFLEE